MTLAKLVKGKEIYLYSIFRILVGLMFLTHGLQKFGVLGGDGVPFMSLFWFAAMIETIGGILIALGLLTRLAALIAAVEMLIAYFMAHAPNGMIPLLNNGEPAVLFFASFLVMIAYGAGTWSLEKLLLRKELF